MAIISSSVLFCLSALLVGISFPHEYRGDRLPHEESATGNEVVWWASPHAGISNVTESSDFLKDRGLVKTGYLRVVGGELESIGRASWRVERETHPESWSLEDAFTIEVRIRAVGDPVPGNWHWSLIAGDLDGRFYLGGSKDRVGFLNNGMDVNAFQKANSLTNSTSPAYGLLDFDASEFNVYRIIGRKIDGIWDYQLFVNGVDVGIQTRDGIAGGDNFIWGDTSVPHGGAYELDYIRWNDKEAVYYDELLKSGLPSWTVRHFGCENFLNSILNQAAGDDGVSYLMKYALGEDRDSVAVAAPLISSSDAETLYVAFDHINSNDLYLELMGSHNLASWHCLAWLSPDASEWEKQSYSSGLVQEAHGGRTRINFSLGDEEQSLPMFFRVRTTFVPETDPELYPGTIRTIQLRQGYDDAGWLVFGIRSLGNEAIVRSVSIRLERSSVADLQGIGDLYLNNEGIYYLRSNDPGGTNVLFLDNGLHDEDPRSGYFRIRVNTSDWPEGEYIFRVVASNRPSDDLHYIRDHRFTVFLRGDVESSLDGSNVSDAVNKVLYREPGIYAAFPRLFVLLDGRLVVSFATRLFQSHIDESGGSLRLASEDGGFSWGPFSGPLVDERWYTASGALVTAEHEGWIYVDASLEQALKDQNKILYPGTTSSGQIAYLGGARVRRSTNGGASWTFETIELPEDLRGLGGYSKRAAELTTFCGNRLVAVYGSRLPESGTVVYPELDRQTEVYFLFSGDDGLTWSCFPMVPGGLTDEGLSLNEAALLQAADGRIVAMIRSGEDDGYLYQSESFDGGLTWSYPAKTPVWGYPAHMVLLEDGRILCAYGYRRDPMGIRAVISYDNGETWDLNNEIILRTDALGNPGDNGMPLMHVLNDGRVFVVYYITTLEGDTHIASTAFRP